MKRNYRSFYLPWISFLRRPFHDFVPLAALAISVLCAATALGQSIDLNSNGMSDIWEQIYGASGLDPNADTDGDGVPNRLEAIAGTDPLDPDSAPKITVGAYLGDHFTVTIPSQLGKQYQLQSIQPMDSGSWTNWTTEATMVSRTGVVVTLSAPAGVSAKVF